jgi:hypothetical protein
MVKSFCFIQHTSYNRNQILSSCTNINIKTSENFISELLKPVSIQPLQTTRGISLFDNTGVSSFFIRWMNQIRYFYTICISKKMIQSKRRIFIWIMSLLIWWNIIPPKMDVSAAIPTITTITTKTKSQQSFHIEPQTQFAQKKQKGDTERKFDHRRDVTRKQRIRLLTGSTVILYTTAIGVAKVNRRNETTSTSNLDRDLQFVENDKISVSNRQENQSTQTTDTNLTWLNPSNNRNNESTTSTVNIPIMPPSVQFLSLRNKMNDTTKVAERLIQASLNTNPMNRSGLDSNDDNQITQKMWFTKNGTSSATTKTTKALQQPKSLVEEAQLQSKYAAIESLEERAYTILVDLGMVEKAIDPFDSAWE